MSAIAVKPMTWVPISENGDTFLWCLSSARPAYRTEDEGQIDARGTNGKIAPLGSLKLRQDLMPVDWIPVLSINSETDQQNQYHETQNPLLLLQAFSVSFASFDFMGLERVWNVPSRIARILIDLTGHSFTGSVKLWDRGG